MTSYTSRERGSADKHSGRFSPVTAPSSRATSRPYHSERWLFSHLFFSMLCLRLSKNCSAFFCVPCHFLCRRRCPCPLTLQPSTFPTGLAVSPAPLLPARPSRRALQPQPRPWHGCSLRGHFGSVLLPRKTSLEQSGPGGFEDLLLYLAEGRHETMGRVSPLRPSRNRLP